MSERLLAAYNQKIVHCCKQIKLVDHEVAVVKESYENGLLKSKRILNHYLKRAENKKSELLQLQDEYFRKMDFIKSKSSIFV